MALAEVRAEWSARVSLYGPHRAVLNVKNSTPEREAEFDRAQRMAVEPLLAAQLSGGKKREMVLDFGCGTGRWTRRLSEMSKGRSIGIDPTPELLEVAKDTAGWDVHFREYRHRIPAERHEFSAIFASLVLNAILDDAMLAETVADMDRVLEPGGLVFIVDVTQRANVRTRWSVLRSVEEYQASFAGVAQIKLLGEYLDLGETHSIMAGRKAL